jgi:hypothetical protein
MKSIIILILFLLSNVNVFAAEKDDEYKFADYKYVWIDSKEEAKEYIPDEYNGNLFRYKLPLSAFPKDHWVHHYTQNIPKKTRLIVFIEGNSKYFIETICKDNSSKKDAGIYSIIGAKISRTSKQKQRMTYYKELRKNSQQKDG